MESQARNNSIITPQRSLVTIAIVSGVRQFEAALRGGISGICADLGVVSLRSDRFERQRLLVDAIRRANDIFSIVKRRDANVARLVCGGPVYCSADVQYLYENTDMQGYVGEQPFENESIEQALLRLWQQGNEGQGDYDYVQYVIDYVSVHFHERLTFSNIAEQVHLSRSYLSTLFGRRTGCSFPQYLSNFRCQRAVELAKSGRQSWKNIALSVGYPDYAHFCKVFKKCMGSSPTQYMVHTKNKGKNNEKNI